MPKLPSDFLSSAKKFVGDEYEQFLTSLEQPPSVSIRLNPFKPCEEFVNTERIPWSFHGRYLDQRPSFTLDPLFHAGCYYVQDASSQFLQTPFKQAKQLLNRRLIVLDLCAAPGGKSTHLLSMISENDLLVSNEIVAARNNVLRQNIIKWGCKNAIVTQNNPSQMAKMKNIFDIIVVDAPCSGEGLFRKDPDAIGEWSLENVKMCSTRQNEILDHAYRMLKPDGVLIYCTCTFEEMENDSQVSRMMEKYGMQFISIENEDEQIVNTKNGLAFYPHRIRGEGFYISMLRKNSGENEFTFRSEKKTARKLSAPKHIKDGETFTPFESDGQSFAIPSIHLPSFNYIKENCYVRLAGIHLGQTKGKDFIPSEALALSNYYNGAFAMADLSLENAIQYLKGNAIPLETPDGFALVRYKEHNLGWAKKVGTRVNNYYPKEWRIKGY